MRLFLVVFLHEEFLPVSCHVLFHQSVRSLMPRIGITTSYEKDEQRLPRRYALAVEAAGGIPMLLPMVAEDTQIHVLESVDGLIVPGGPAVTDGLVGALPDDLGSLDPVRTASDRHYLQAAMTQNKPILGICYGMQVLNALAGGTIYGDVEKQHPGARAHSQKRGAATHDLRIDETSQLYDALHQSTVTVNTRHLQAIATVGDGFRTVATAPDGVIEAIEHHSGRMRGVQFHPERMGEAMQPLFRDFVRQATPSSATA